ncbi:Ldh family oxidoreductase [Thiospirochaeta perfilievii]|uniref:Ldh family oxidoreductase n=1 Tax=Thiospirochaeta perfilievii TaxID=252967 RepID=A0A5C1QGK0_9SPIO|nr:Ldh family oxidoreductase [Thiospirochaeta perfilievii]QEN05744.1 Ldh family oxidoreductase [Thiospirochaeta perfilievii]
MDLKMYDKCKWIDFEVLKDFMIKSLTNVGVPEDQAEIVADVLITSDKRGIDSHGIGRLKPIYIDRIDNGILNPETKVTIIKENKGVAVLDGNNGLGHVVSYKAMNLAIEKAKEYGISMVTVRNSTHYGIAGYYPLMAIKEGMIGITGTNARPSIAPTFGVENMLGTNPFTFGIPTDEEFPFVLDCATSISQRGKIEVYAREGRETPNNWVIDRDGNPMTNSLDILSALTSGKAALNPLGGSGEDGGGYKGYGFATIVEIFSAALQDGKFLKDLSGKDENGDPIPYPLGHFFIVIDPDFFMGRNLFKKIAGTILRSLRESKKSPHEERIYTAGEKEWLAWNLRKDKGCPIPESLELIIKELSQRFSIENPLKDN